LINDWIDVYCTGEVLQPKVQFKMVVANSQDAREVANLIVYSHTNIPFIIQPEESANNYRELPDLMGRAFRDVGTTKLNQNIRYIPQVHKMTGWR
jgi:organic radical activating enzyme